MLVTAAFEGQDFGECGHVRALEAVIRELLSEAQEAGQRSSASDVTLLLSLGAGLTKCPYLRQPGGQLDERYLEVKYGILGEGETKATSQFLQG